MLPKWTLHTAIGLLALPALATTAIAQMHDPMETHAGSDMRTIEQKIAIAMSAGPSEIATGARISEILGLQWRHIDLQGGVIHIAQRNWRGDIDDPKSKTSKRPLTLGYLVDRYNHRGSSDDQAVGHDASGGGLRVQSSGAGTNRNHEQARRFHGSRIASPEYTRSSRGLTVHPQIDSRLF